MDLKQKKNGGGLYQQKQNQLIPGLPDDLAMECMIRVPYMSHSEMGSVCKAWKALISSDSFYKERQRFSFAEHLLCLVQPLPVPKPAQAGSDNRIEVKVDGNEVLENKESSEHRILQAQSQTQPSYGLSIFNATSRTWNRISRITTSENYSDQIPMFCHCVALPKSKKLILIGGWDPETLEPVKTVYVYNFVTRNCTQAASMSEQRSFFACAAVGESKVYVAGGHDSQKNALKSAEVYDAEKDEWTKLPEMDKERDECHGLAWSGEGKFWVVSGYGTDCQGQFRRDAECYDPETCSWTSVDDVWPFASLSPKCTAAVTVQNRREWWWFLGSQQQQQAGTGMENGSLSLGEVRSVIQAPEGISGSNAPPSVVSFGCSDQVFVMGGRGNASGTSALSSPPVAGAEARPCCDGVGAFSLGMDRKWGHIYTPSGFSGIPYTASYLSI